MMQKKALTPFQLVMRNLPHLTEDEKVTVAKTLAAEYGVQMYTPADAERVVQLRVKQELAKRSANLFIPGR